MVKSIPIEQVYLKGKEIQLIWDTLSLINEGVEPSTELQIKRIQLSSKMDIINELLLDYRKENPIV
jgi:hypothetical protein